MSSTQNSDQRNIFDEEQKYSWLPMLLDAHWIIDQGVARDIAEETSAQRTLACHRGCANCCKTHKEIPILPLELVGITWYCSEKISGEARNRLITQLESHTQRNHCPFLLDDECAIHPVRPTACRLFNVFNQACATDEDAFHSRPDDVLKPDSQYINNSYYATLEFYKVQDEQVKQKIISEQGMQAIASDLRQVDWQSVANKMHQIDTLNKEQ